MNLHHGGHDVSRHKRVVHTIVSLRFAVANIGHEVMGGTSTCGLNTGICLSHQLIQMGATGVTMPVAAFHDNLRLAQLLDLPAATQPERIQFRCQLT